jgi:DNA-binding NarL/FixJ family response regulator
VANPQSRASRTLIVLPHPHVAITYNYLTSGPEKSRGMKILFIDDHELVQGGMERTLALVDPTFVVTCGFSLEEGMNLVTENQFDFVFADLRLGEFPRGGFDIISACTRRGIRSAIISGEYDAVLIAEAAKRGACAYFPKAYKSDVMATLFRLVLKHDLSHAPLIADLPGNSVFDRMPEECHKIMALVCENKANKEIAKELGMGMVSVKKYLHVCNSLFGVENRGDAKRVYLELLADAQATK